MAFTDKEKAYLNNVKQNLDQDQWLGFLELTKAQQKNQLISKIDQDLDSLNTALTKLDTEKTLRETYLNGQISDLTAFKLKLQNL